MELDMGMNIVWQEWNQVNL